MHIFMDYSFDGLYVTTEENDVIFQIYHFPFEDLYDGRAGFSAAYLQVEYAATTSRFSESSDVCSRIII